MVIDMHVAVAVYIFCTHPTTACHAVRCVSPASPAPSFIHWSCCYPGSQFHSLVVLLPRLPVPLNGRAATPAASSTHCSCSRSALNTQQ